MSASEPNALRSRKLERTKTPGVFRRGGVYVVVYRDASGKQHKQRARTLTEGRAIKSAMTTDVRRGEWREQSRVRFDEHWQQWLANYAGRTSRGFRETTRDDYRRDLEQHAAPYFRRMWLAEIAPQHIKQWLTKLANEGYAAGTLRNALAPVRAMLADAAEDGLIRFNPAAGIRIPATAKQPDSRPKELAPAQLERLRSKVTDDALQLVVDFLVATGLRISELIALDWSDVNLSRCRVTVRRRLYRGMDAPKSLTSRRVLKISPTMTQRLGQLWESQGQPSPDSPVFLSPRGCRCDYSNTYKRLVPVMRAAGIDYGAFHRFRHTNGTELRRRGVPLEEIQLQLGHHDLAFTQRVYVHTDAEDGPDPEILDDLAGCVPSLRVVREEAA